ncbi:MAG: protein SCO1/2 [Motiliproteus sp.]|jgi:protein SCO1/2
MRVRQLLGAGLMALLFTLLATLQAAAAESLPVLRGIGGDFSAQSTLGRELSLKEFRGKPLLLFFGYTNCSDICPATLGHLSKLTQGNPDAVQVLFVSIDPKNDTAKHLKAYLAHFDEHYIGISDEIERIDAIVALFQARYSRVGDRELSTKYKKFKVPKKPLEPGAEDKAYLYTHSATIYLLDKKGRTRATYFNGTPISQMRTDIASLITE